MAKPFSIQAPEAIAKEYAGNKQSIAQAAQMGIIDPTAAVLAGMFIDRMRSAQVMEASPQQTVAQQVLGAGETPQAPAGLGATPEAAMPQMGGAMPTMGGGEAMPPQEMAPPAEEMPMMAEGGMVPPYASGGGLSDVPIPDGMFDEPSNGGFNDGYSGGGLVAFASGGMSNLYDDVEYWESGGKQGAVSPKGARGVMQLMPGTMKDPGYGIEPMRDDSEKENRRVGQQYLDAMYRKYGNEKTALAAYNWGPGNVDKWLESGADPKKLPSETKKYISNVTGGKANPAIPERNIDTAQGQIEGAEDYFSRLMNRFGPTEKEQEIDAKRMARAEELMSEEYQEKERKSDMWQTLAEIGFNMASSKSPYLLQAVGEAAAAAMPDARADKKARKALMDRGLTLAAEVSGESRREALPMFKLAVDMAKDNISQKNFRENLDLEQQQVDIQSADVDAKLLKIMADGQGKENTKERFIQTFYDQFIKKGYDPTLARQYAYITAEKALAKVQRDSEGLFGDEETGGNTGKNNVVQFDYATMK